jgi:hypothetical protein
MGIKKGHWKCTYCNEQKPKSNWQYYLDNYKAKHGKECPFQPYRVPCQECNEHEEVMRIIFPLNLETTAWKLYRNEEFVADMRRVLKLVHPDMDIKNPNNGELLLQKHRAKKRP